MKNGVTTHHQRNHDRSDYSYSSEPEVFTDDRMERLRDSNESIVRRSLPKHVTTSSLASHLFRGRAGYSPPPPDANVSRSSISSSDLDLDSSTASASATDPVVLVSEEELSDLNNRMVKIKRELEQQRDADEKYEQMKRQNATLHKKLNALEEQMMLADDKGRAELAEAERRYKELLAHTEREKGCELDALVLRCRLVEQEHDECANEREKLIRKAKEAERECDRLRELVGDLKREFEDSENARRISEQRLWQEKEDVEKRLRIALETCEDLRGDLHRLKNEHDRADGTTSELEEELHRLKEEQTRLRRANDELQAELVNASMEHGQKLVWDRGPSLAEEMIRMSKDEVLDALREQEIVNKKLRSYVDGILLRIMEIYPEILEIKPAE